MTSRKYEGRLCAHVHRYKAGLLNPPTVEQFQKSRRHVEWSCSAGPCLALSQAGPVEGNHLESV
jgi:hypothetical protein